MPSLNDAKDSSFKAGSTVRIYFRPTGTTGGNPIFPSVQGKVVRTGSDGIVIEYDGKTVTFNWDAIGGVEVV